MGEPLTWTKEREAAVRALAKDLNKRPKYAPHTTVAALGWLVEECGEVHAAVGKTLRHGLDSYDPTPGAPHESNADWILREMRDAERAISEARRFIVSEMDVREGPACWADSAGPALSDLLAEIDALRAALDAAEGRVRLPVIATCGDCAHAVTEDHEEWLCVQSDPEGESLGLATDVPDPIRSAPPPWCPLRAVTS